MKSKKIIYLIIGLFTLILGAYFSSIQYNAVKPFTTVHGFTCGCITQIPEFVNTCGDFNN